jgi:S-ribosylhomocysteine lyase
MRNSEIADHVIYFGPMGCQTGFYLVIKGVDSKKTFEVVKKVFKQTVDHEGDVFGKSAIECGHYENLDIQLAKTECQRYLDVLNSWSNMEFTYPE